MRPVCCALSALLVCSAVAHAGENLTLLVQFEGNPSQQSVQVMKDELQILMKNVAVDWKLLDELGPGESFPDLVVVKFKGSCQVQKSDPVAPFLIDERGPLAFTHTTDGQVLPFSEVECDRLRQTLKPLTRGVSQQTADILLGRALGRVLAHELYHVRSNTKKHEKEGVNRRGLTLDQLAGKRSFK